MALKGAMIFVQGMDIICSKKWTVFREPSLWKTVLFEEQTMSKDKYHSSIKLFLCQMEAIVFYVSFEIIR